MHKHLFCFVFFSLVSHRTCKILLQLWMQFWEFTPSSQKKVSLTSTLIWCGPHESDENENRSMQWLVAEHKIAWESRVAKNDRARKFTRFIFAKGVDPCFTILRVLVSFMANIPWDWNSYAFRVTPFLECNFRIDYMDSWLWKATDIIFEKNATQIMHPRESIFRSDWHC